VTVELDLGQLQALPDGLPLSREAAGRPVLVVRLGDEVHAYADACLHRQGRLSDGLLSGCVLICPLHWWRYDVRDGELLGSHGTRRLERFACDLRDGRVIVLVPEPAAPVSWRERLLAAARERERLSRPG